MTRSGKLSIGVALTFLTAGAVFAYRHEIVNLFSAATAPEAEEASFPGCFEVDFEVVEKRFPDDYYGCDVPQISGLQSAAAEQAINADLGRRRKQALEAIAEIERRRRSEGFSDASSSGAGGFPPSGSHAYFDGYNVLPINIVTIKYTDELWGGAHPNWGHRTVMYDLSSGKVVTFSDLFRDDQACTSFFAECCIAEFRKCEEKRTDEEWDQWKRGFCTNKEPLNFALTDEGLTLTFDPYEIFSFAAGTQRVVIPYDRLRPYLRPELLHAYSSNRSTFSLARLECFLSSMRSAITADELVEKTTFADESYYRSKLFAVDLDPQSLLASKDYDTRIWLGVLQTLATKAAEMDGRLDKYRIEPYKLDLVKFFLDRMGDMTEILKDKKASSLGRFRDSFGDLLRKTAVATGALKSENATFRSTYSLAGKVANVAGIALWMLSSYDAVTDLQKAVAMAVSVEVFDEMTNLIVPAMKAHTLYGNRNVRSAVDHYASASATAIDAQKDMTAADIALDAGALAIGLATASRLFALGVVLTAWIPEPSPAEEVIAGSFTLVAGEILIGLSPGSWVDGMQYILSKNICDRLLTLFLSSDRCSVRETALNALAASSFCGLFTDYVRGKGVISGAGEALGGDEKKWNNVCTHRYSKCADDVWIKLRYVCSTL